MISLITTSAPRAAPARDRPSVITARPMAAEGRPNISAALLIANRAGTPAIYGRLLAATPRAPRALRLHVAKASCRVNWPGKSVEGKPLKVSLFQAQLPGVARIFFGAAQTKICKV